MLNISIHDVTKSKLRDIKLLSYILKDFGIHRISYLVIPFYHEREHLEDIIDFIESVKDDEIIMHGYTHKSKPFAKYDYKNIFTNYEAEFLLSEDLKDRLRFGLEAFNKIGIYPKGFIAPAWLMKTEAFGLLKEKGFSFTTDRRYVYNLKSNNKVFSPVISFGSRGFVRFLSIKAFKHQFMISKTLKFIRIALHPTDAKDFRKIKILTSVLKEIRSKDFIISDLYHISKAKNLIKN